MPLIQLIVVLDTTKNNTLNTEFSNPTTNKIELKKGQNSNICYPWKIKLKNQKELTNQLKNTMELKKNNNSIYYPSNKEWLNNIYTYNIISIINMSSYIIL